MLKEKKIEFNSKISLALLAAGSLMLAGCSSGSVSSSETEPEEETTNESAEVTELKSVTVGAIPVADMAPLYYAMDEGLFEEHGLDIDLQFAQGGAAIIPAVVSGEYDFGFSNVVSLLVASENDIPINVILNASTSPNEPGNEPVEVLVPGDSDIESAKDLEGKTVAINALNNFGDITIRNAVEQAGGDANSVKFVEIPYPNMPAQFASGEVDAVWGAEPFRTDMLDEGGRVATSPLPELGDHIDLAFYFTSTELLETDPEVVDSFRAAMREAMEITSEDRDKAVAAILKHTQVEDEVAEVMALPTWPVDINRDGLNLLVNKSIDYGVLKEEPDLEDLIKE